MHLQGIRKGRQEAGNREIPYFPLLSSCFQEEIIMITWKIRVFLETLLDFNVQVKNDCLTKTKLLV